MALNYDALEQMQLDLEKRTSGGGDNKFIDVTKLKNKETITIRVAPPQEGMNGVVFVEEKGYWIYNKRYVTSNTFGGKDPLQKLIDLVETDGTDTQKGLLKIWKGGFQKKSNFYLPVLVLEMDYDRTGRLIGKEFKQNGILSCGIGVLNDIMKEVLSKYNMNTGDGIADIKLGRNFDITKVVTKDQKGNDKTTYKVVMDPNVTEMEEEWYDDIPNIVDMVTKKVVSDEEVKNAFKNYIYGIPMPETPTTEAIVAESKKYQTEVTAEDFEPEIDKKKSKVSIKELMEDE